MTVLMYVLGAYLAACWLWGIYLVIRLYAGRRIGRVLKGHGLGPRIIRPLNPTSSTPPPPTPVTRKPAEPVAGSRAA